MSQVVYGLNTRGEELEGQLALCKDTEDALKDANADLQRRATLYKNKVNFILNINDNFW